MKINEAIQRLQMGIFYLKDKEALEVIIKNIEENKKILHDLYECRYEEDKIICLTERYWNKAKREAENED